MPMQMVVRTALLILVLVAPISASAAEYNPEDEGRAFAGSASTPDTEYGTAEQAEAMLNRAIAEVKANKLAAIEKFNHNAPQFRDRDLFVFCFNVTDGKFTAHEAFVGSDARKLVDKTGRWYGEKMYQNAREDEIAEVSFVSPLPGSTELVEKRAFVTLIGDQVCGSSAYRFNGRGSATQ
jgi:hypothetical protein